MQSNAILGEGPAAVTYIVDTGLKIRQMEKGKTLRPLHTREEKESKIALISIPRSTVKTEYGIRVIVPKRFCFNPDPNNGIKRQL